jgi:hypothetical protein
MLEEVLAWKVNDFQEFPNQHSHKMNHILMLANKIPGAKFSDLEVADI